MIVTLYVIWYVVGVASFVYWWTKDHDLQLGEVIVAMFVGLIGPIAFLAGSYIHGGSEGITIIKQRKQ